MSGKMSRPTLDAVVDIGSREYANEPWHINAHTARNCLRRGLIEHTDRKGYPCVYRLTDKGRAVAEVAEQLFEAEARAGRRAHELAELTGCAP